MKRKNLLILIASILVCQNVFAMETVMDVHTQSNYRDVPVENMSMNLSLDMDKKVFHGTVDVQINNSKNKDELILDTKALKIEKVEVASSTFNANFEKAHFELGQEHTVLGQALKVKIEPSTKVVRIHYSTTEKSTGIDWKDKSLTADGFPMVTTQFQAINARTFVPCQDTPAQKITYSAQIALHSEVADPRMRVVMAANKREVIGNRLYRFSMTLKIPTYLIALAAGVFEEVPISDRVKVIAEPSMVKKAALEFADAEKMVQSAESLFGKYVWDRFDIFIMPPSFSYGGMENPTMTFIGPTVVAGDKSLVDVIAHELAHSWSGNLVTNKTWNDFWINEGTTMYVERLIIEALYGKKLRDLDVVLGQQVLTDNIKEVSTSNPALTCLHTKLSRDFDPDDAVTHIPYEKGFNFWLALEHAYGRVAVVQFLKKMFKDYEFGSMDTKTLHQLILNHDEFLGAKKMDLDNWLYGEGLPSSGLVHVESHAINDVITVTESLRNNGQVTSIMSKASGFETKQWSYLLRNVKSLNKDQVIKLEKTFKLSQKNDEVRSNFFELAIKSGQYATYKASIGQYLGRVGRIKYAKPIYFALKEVGLMNEASELFLTHRSKHNHITNASITRAMGFTF